MKTMHNNNSSETKCRWCKYHRWYLEGKKYGCSSEPNENICPSYRSLNEEYSADYIKSVMEGERNE